MHAPAGRDVLDDLANALGNLLAALNHVLQHARADDVAQRGLGPLDEGLANIRDTEGGLVRGDDVVVDDRSELQRDIVLGHADLHWDLDDLDLDVNLDQALAQGVDLDEAGIDGLVEPAKLGDQADVALADALERVRAADAAGDGAHGSDNGADGIDCPGSASLVHPGAMRTGSAAHTHGPVPALRVSIGNDAGIALLQILELRRLDRHVRLGSEAAIGSGSIEALALG